MHKKTQKPQPKVSILIPVYNVEPYLKECLDSVIHQTLRDIEIICVDDGSTDASGQMLDTYAAQDRRIKVIHKENGGYGKAMNTAYAHATGEYIGIVEPDDYVSLDMYQTLYEKAVENDVDFIKADFLEFVDNNLERKFFERPLSKEPIYYDKILDPHTDVKLFYFNKHTWSGIYKKSFLDRYNIKHNETPGASFQDNGFWFQTFCRANRVYFHKYPLYRKRADNPNSSVNNREKVFCIIEEYDYIRKILDNDLTLQPFIGIYQSRRLASYLFHFRRIGLEFKKIFLHTIAKQYKLAYQNNEIDESLFFAGELKALKTLIKDPMKYYRKALHRLSLTEKIFSVTNDGIYKVIHIVGLKFKFTNMKLLQRQTNEKLLQLTRKIDRLSQRMDYLVQNIEEQLHNEKIVH